MRRTAIVALAAALALGGTACSSGDDEEGAVDAGAADVAVEAGGEDGSGGGEAVPVSQPADAAGSVPAVGPRIVQTAALSVSVPQDGFEDAVRSARTAATGAGGFVVSSSASQGSAGRLVTGTLVLRVPERAYARVLDRLADLGRIEAREESGQDVSQESGDLEARIRHLEAVETQLLGFLGEAGSVSDALAVQTELNRVQLELEQARGRLAYLDDQVAFATITLEVWERQAAAASAGGGGPWGIVDAWRAAGTGFVTVLGWIFVVAATLAPLALLLGLAYAAARLAGVRLPGPRRPSA